MTKIKPRRYLTGDALQMIKDFEEYYRKEDSYTVWINSKAIYIRKIEEGEKINACILKAPNKKDISLIEMLISISKHIGFNLSVEKS